MDSAENPRQRGARYGMTVRMRCNYIQSQAAQHHNVATAANRQRLIRSAGGPDRNTLRMLGD
jgi:ribosomal protein L37AE/L43A